MKFLNRVHISALLVLVIAIAIGVQAKPLREGFYQVTGPTVVDIKLNCTSSSTGITCATAPSGAVKNTQPAPAPAPTMTRVATTTTPLTTTPPGSGSTGSTGTTGTIVNLAPTLDQQQTNLQNAIVAKLGPPRKSNDFATYESLLASMAPNEGAQLTALKNQFVTAKKDTATKKWKLSDIGILLG